MPEQTEPVPGLAIAPYFQPPQGYFWRWAEGNEVVEWVNGTTITYREELAALLTGLAPTGLPPLGAVLLLLAACNTGWKESSAEIGLLQGLLRGLPPGGPPDEELTFHLSVARTFLDIIRELPPELRQGVAKEHLLREVLSSSNSAGYFAILPSKRIASDLTTYHETELIQSEFQLTRWQFETDLRCFDRATRRFPTVHGLELRLRTGLDQLPEPLEETPAPPPPAEPAADLLAELAQDRQTAGLARLVPHLRAALHLPHTAPQASEQPLGGVADLSNRGPLDRLLLSELAQDDLSLLARLAHGEALYLRREAPPLPQPPPRVFLLDTTLLMWGLPRVAGLAAALALAAPGHAEPPQAFALWSHHAQLLDLRSRAGVVAALGLLDPALHCGAALAAVLPTLPAPAEALLITEANAARQPDFRVALAAAPAALRFLLTVARSGELVLYELRGGRRTVLSTTQVDLEQLLAGDREPRRAAGPAVVLPAFMQQAKAPLFFPTLHVAATAGTMLHDEKRGAIGVDKYRRLLYWPSAGTGALELWPGLEEGSYGFGFGTRGQPLAYVLVGSSGRIRKPALVLYIINLVQLTVQRVDLSAKLNAYADWVSIDYAAAKFYLVKAIDKTDLVVDCQLHTLTSQSHYFATKPAAAPSSLPPANFLNPGYSVLQRVNRMGISHNGLLTIENRQVVIGSAVDDVLLLETVSDATITQPTTRTGSMAQRTATPGIRCERLTWPDGSEAIVDGRGLLHLRSADNTLAEFTLVLAIDRPTAAWAADGVWCGSSYFTGGQALATGLVPVDEFYEHYLQPFIDHITR
ncbi:hypothetical protein GCM10027422_38330 [Hymenobacter arcticus]